VIFARRLRRRARKTQNRFCRRFAAAEKTPAKKNPPKADRKRRRKSGKIKTFKSLL